SANWPRTTPKKSSSSTPRRRDTRCACCRRPNISSSSRALDAMQAKHRAMVQQFTRRASRDAVDAFIEDFDARAKRYRSYVDTFIPVTLSEPWVVEQTLRLIHQIDGEIGAIDVPFVVLNRAVHDI